MLCNPFRTEQPQRVFFGAVFCFVIAALMSLFYHPASDWSRGFALGFTGVLFVTEIAFSLVYLMTWRKAAGARVREAIAGSSRNLEN